MERDHITTYMAKYSLQSGLSINNAENKMNRCYIYVSVYYKMERNVRKVQNSDCFVRDDTKNQIKDAKISI